MRMIIGSIAVATVVALSSPALAASNNNQTPAQLLCSESAIANMVLKTSDIRGEDARRMAREELAAASSDQKAQRRADCIAHMQSAMKFFSN